MQIFIVSQNSTVQGEWEDCVSNEVISYHKTVEGADKKVAELASKKLIDISETMKLNPNLSIDYWDDAINCVKNNLLYNHYEEYPLFEINAVEVLD